MSILGITLYIMSLYSNTNSCLRRILKIRWSGTVSNTVTGTRGREHAMLLSAEHEIKKKKNGDELDMRYANPLTFRTPDKLWHGGNN